MTRTDSLRPGRTLLSEIEQRYGEVSADLGAYLRRHQLRSTPGRVSVLIALAEAGDSTPAHLSALELLTAVADLGARVEQTTVYRTLSTLVELGAVHQVLISGRPALYGLNEPPHDHAVCDRCFLLRPIPVDVGDGLRRFATSETGYAFPMSGAITLRGLCAACQNDAGQLREGEL